MLKRHGLILSVVMLVLLLLAVGCTAPTGGTQGATPAAPDATNTPAEGDGALPGNGATPAGTETGNRAVPPDAPVSSDDPTPPAETPDPGEEGEYIVSEAQVESVDAMILESFPVQVRVHVQGWMGACDEIVEPEVNREGNTFHVELKTRTLAGQACTMQLLSFERTIPLDVAGLEAGEYVVEVNGVTTTFTLEVDNVLDGSAGNE